MIAADEDGLERVRDNIDTAENEYVKYADMITDKKNKLEMLTSKENEGQKLPHPRQQGFAGTLYRQRLHAQ